MIAMGVFLSFHAVCNFFSPVTWIGLWKTFHSLNRALLFSFSALHFGFLLSFIICFTLLSIQAWLFFCCLYSGALWQKQKTNLKIAFNCDNLSDWNSSDVLKIYNQFSLWMCVCALRAWVFATAFVECIFLFLHSACYFHTIFVCTTLNICVCANISLSQIIYFYARAHNGYHIRYI